MEVQAVQAECAEPPAATTCDPQPTGKINKAAFKLFGKRRSGSGMASFFSFRNKGAVSGNGNNRNSGNGNSVNGSGLSASAELIRSKTHDGLTGANNEVEGLAGEALGGQEVGPVRSLSKSLSFFSLLRRGSVRATDSGGAGLARRGRGLKGLFSSIRWRRRDKTLEGGGDIAEAQEAKDVEVEVAHHAVADITLILEPPPHQQPQQHHHDDDGNGSLEGERGRPEVEPEPSNTTPPPHCVAASEVCGEPDSPFPCTPTDSPLRTPRAAKAKSSVSTFSPSSLAGATPPLDRCSVADPPSEPSVDRLCSLLFTDVTSLKSFDSLTGCGDIIADAEDEGASGNGGSGTSSSSSGGGGAVGAGGGKAAAASPSRGTPSKPPQLTHALPLSAAPCPPQAPLPARARVPPTPPPPPPPPPAQQHPHPAGSGVVAYMGGGEEMASPEGVDDADMQGLWHMLPSTGDNSPALPRMHQAPAAGSNAPGGHHHHHHHHPAASRSAERKVAQVKPLGLSKIPVVGGAGAGAGARAAKPPLPHSHPRHATSPSDKEPLSDEGYWDTPSATPTATPDDGGLQRARKTVLSRDSCLGDHLYDLYDDPQEEREEEDEEDEDLTSTPSPGVDDKLSPPSQATPPSSSSSSSFRSMKGSTSLPRDSKIPVCVRQTTPPHSVSQSALSSVLEADVLPPKSQEPPPVRTRIPVSKVPVRRPGNKPSNTGRGTTHK